jgi:DNA-binding response OmpR family regulator
VLLVEDNRSLNKANAEALKLRGYEVYTALTLNEARKHLASINPDIILLDVMLPDGNGFDFCEEISAATDSFIIFLTAKAEHEDMVQGIKSGGDVYITKPFHPEEMLVKADGIMRRKKRIAKTSKQLKVGGLSLEPTSLEAYFYGKALGLTPKEYALLLLLMQNENKVLIGKQIYETIWNAPMIGNSNALHKTISRLRSKLKLTGYTIELIYGKGYIFQKE